LPEANCIIPSIETKIIKIEFILKKLSKNFLFSSIINFNIRTKNPYLIKKKDVLMECVMFSEIKELINKMNQKTKKIIKKRFLKIFILFINI
jgi:hypothetical protein